MSPSTLFWIDLLMFSVVSVIGMAWVIVLLVGGGYRRFEKSPVLFAVPTAFSGLLFAIGNASYWLDVRILSDRGGFGNPATWFELALAGLVVSSSALPCLAVYFRESSVSSNHTDRTVVRKPTGHQRFVSVGSLILGFALLPTVLSHSAIQRIFINQNRLVRLELTGSGYVVSLVTLLIELLALLVIWRSHSHSARSGMTLGLAFWITGHSAIVFSNAAVPIGSFALSIGLLVTGYTVSTQLVAGPWRALAEELDATLSDRTREIQHARAKLELQARRHFQFTRIVHQVGRMSSADELIARVVELIHHGLGFEYVLIYQPDSNLQHLVIGAVAGTTEDTLLESQRRLTIGGLSIPGQAAQKQLPLIAQARGSDAAYFQETVLPGARAEMAVPMMIGDRLLGILDVQSNRYDAFSERDLSDLISIAEQIVIALERARLTQENQEALSVLDRIQREHLNRAEETAFREPDRGWAFTYTDQKGVVPIDLSGVASSKLSSVTADTDHDPSSVDFRISIHGRTIGALQLTQKQGQPWLSEDVEAVADLVERLGPALEAARLSEEAKRRALLEQRIGRATAQMRETLDVETVLRTAVNEIYQALQLDQVTIQLSSDGHESLAPIHNGADENGA